MPLSLFLFFLGGGEGKGKGKGRCCSILFFLRINVVVFFWGGKVIDSRLLLFFCVIHAVLFLSFLFSFANLLVFFLTFFSLFLSLSYQSAFLFFPPFVFPFLFHHLVFSRVRSLTLISLWLRVVSLSPFLLPFTPWFSHTLRSLIFPVPLHLLHTHIPSSSPSLLRVNFSPLPFFSLS